MLIMKCSHGGHLSTFTIADIGPHAARAADGTLHRAAPLELAGARARQNRSSPPAGDEVALPVPAAAPVSGQLVARLRSCSRCGVPTAGSTADAGRAAAPAPRSAPRSPA